jgi:hypothetical protein
MPAMHTSIQFHHQAVLWAAEIGSIRTQRVLPAKLEAFQPKTAKQKPSGFFRFRGRVAKLPRSLNVLRCPSVGAGLAVRSCGDRHRCLSHALGC